MKRKKVKKLKKKLRRSTLFFLVLMLITNSFAWFIYTSKISNSINAHVKSWLVTFDQDGNPLEDTVEFTIDSIYPGMKDFTDSITINNSGETTAYITYQVTSIKVFDEVLDTSSYTSDELISFLNTKYPFLLTFEVSDDEIETSNTSSFNVKLSWPYESGRDELDTYYGKKSYDFSQNYPEENQIEIVVKIKASQSAE